MYNNQIENLYYMGVFCKMGGQKKREVYLTRVYVGGANIAICC